jgi:hypothetical protein
VERFASPPSRLFGLVMMGLAVLLIGYVLIGDPGRDRKAIVFALLLEVVCWVVLVRPTISAQANGVLITNMLRDVFVPWSRIERARVLHTLQIVTDDNQHFHGLGISRSSRQMLKRHHGRSSLLSGAMTMGLSGTPMYSRRSEPADVREMRKGMVYQDYVETRIERLARESRPDASEPVKAWAWSSFALLAVGVVLAVLLFV